MEHTGITKIGKTSIGWEQQIVTVPAQTIPGYNLNDNSYQPTITQIPVPTFQPLVMADGMEVPQDRLHKMFDALFMLLKLSPEERAFLQAIAERPYAQDVWLIYADWLEEQGQFQRAEMMREKAKKLA